MEQKVVVSGSGIVPYDGVRVSWVVDNMTITAAVAKLDDNTNYKVELSVPEDAEPGKAKICAVVTGAVLGEFVCKEFTVDQAPPGSVKGKIPIHEESTALFRMEQFTNEAYALFLDPYGMLVYSTTIETDGSFYAPELPVGELEVVFVGDFDEYIESTWVDVRPDREIDCFPEYSPSDVTAWTTDVTATPNGFRFFSDSFGHYVSAPNDPDMELEINIKPHIAKSPDVLIERVEYELVREDGTIERIGTIGEPPWELRYKVNQLPPGTHLLSVTPIPSYGRGEHRWKKIEVIENPMNDPFIRDSQISWNDTEQVYEFSGTIPDVYGLLPFVYPDPPPDVWPIGEIENKADAGVEFAGQLYLFGVIRIQLLDAMALLRLFSQDIYNGRQHILTPGEEQLLFVSGGDLTEMGLEFGPYNLYSFYEEWPIVDIPFGIPYLADLHISIGIGLGGDLYLEGTVRPLKPAIEAQLTPSVYAQLFLDVAVRFLIIASGGARVNARLGVAFPLCLDTTRSTPVWLDDPCLFAGADLKLYTCIWFFGTHCADIYTFELFEWESEDGCIPSTILLSETTSDPKVMASPAIDSGPGGEVLAVYIEDSTPEEEMPAPKVMARFWDSQNDKWKDPISLTDGKLFVLDPAVAFVGDEGHAIVAWTQNVILSTEAGEYEGKYNAVIGQQEIYYAYWNGFAWGSPQRLTNDEMSEGLASIAGDIQGATLAWVKDTDGNISTIKDWRIAVTHWDISKGEWEPVELLSFPERDDVNSLAVEPLIQSGIKSQKALLREVEYIPSAVGGELHVCPTCSYTSVQAAVDAAKTGDVIKVAAGTYTGIQARNGVTQTVYVDKSVTIRGGYSMNDWATFDPVTNRTTLDAQGKGRGFYITGNINPTIEGFWVRGGDANEGSGDRSSGGGIYIEGASAIVRHNVISDNEAGGMGAGIYLENSSSTVNGNIISSNEASYGEALALGGGLALVSSDALIEGNRVELNSAVSGGGIIVGYSDATFTNNVISDNTISQYAAGVLVGGSDPVFEHTTIARNSGGDGSGIMIIDTEGTPSHVGLNNSIIVSQTVGVKVTAPFGNVADLDGVLWFKNTANTGGGGIVNSANQYSGDPAFDYDGYHLTQSSAAIDKGQDTGVSDDIDREARPNNDLPDLGADEYYPGRGVANYEISVARDNGHVVLAWTVDEDGDLTTNDDRQIVVADKTLYGWDIETPNAIPLGSDSPSVVVKGWEELYLGFLVRGDVAGGQLDAGYGNLAKLWTAKRDNYGWYVNPVLDKLGEDVRAEQPRVSIGSSGEVALLFRRFGAFGTNAYLGQLAVSHMRMGLSTTEPIYLTDDAYQHWQPAMAINQQTGDMVVLNVNEPVTGGTDLSQEELEAILAPSYLTARGDLESIKLNLATAPVESLTIESGPDPALDPTLMISQQHAEVGKTVVVTATVRNVGREPAENMSVRFYAGDPSSGTLLKKIDIPDWLSLDMNETYDVSYEVTASGGEQQISAEVTTNGGDLSTINNIATVDIGKLPPPTFVNAAVSTRYPGALAITWMLPEVDGVEGFRILRSETLGGPYELVGESAEAEYHDLLLDYGQAYYYVVQTYDAAGVRSVYSDEASGSLAYNTHYLPIIHK
jgi:hypothetical protein